MSVRNPTTGKLEEHHRVETAEGDLLHITVTRSAGDDGALLVIIDTEFEPDGSDGGPGLRVMVNDGDVFEGVPLGPAPIATPASDALHVLAGRGDDPITEDWPNTDDLRRDMR